MRSSANCGGRTLDSVALMCLAAHARRPPAAQRYCMNTSRVQIVPAAIHANTARRVLSRIPLWSLLPDIDSGIELRTLVSVRYPGLVARLVIGKLPIARAEGRGVPRVLGLAPTALWDNSGFHPWLSCSRCNRY